MYMSMSCGAQFLVAADLTSRIMIMKSEIFDHLIPFVEHRSFTERSVVGAAEFISVMSSSSTYFWTAAQPAETVAGKVL